MDYLSIDTDFLRKIAGEISGISQRVEASYGEIDETIENLTTNGWQTDASVKFQTEFDSHKSAFKSTLQRLSSSGETLSTIAGDYDSTEQNIMGMM